MASGIASGIISGLIVSVFISLINHYRKPKFQLCYTAEGKATLFNNRFRSVVLGGTWVFGVSDGVLSTADARAATSGVMLKKMSQTYWDTHNISVGDYVEIAYRPYPVFPLRKEQKQREIVGWSKNPADWYSEVRAEHGNWKHVGLVFQHG